MAAPESELSSPTPPEPTAGFSRAAKWITRRTTDLLAVAILAVGLLAVGGQLHRWWTTTPEEVTAANQTLPQALPWGDNGQGVSLAWGELPYAMRHQTTFGDADAVAKRLEEIALERLADLPTMESPATEAERRLLLQLADLPASLARAGDVRLYRFGPQLPMILITAPSRSPSSLADPTPRRVMCWGRAFPKSADEWTIFLFHPAEETSALAARGEQIPLPEPSQRIQSLHEAGGRTWIAFRGEGTSRDWQIHFERWFQEHNWRCVRAWSKSINGWSATFVSAEEDRRADLWMATDQPAPREGVIFVEPAGK